MYFKTFLIKIILLYTVKIAVTQQTVGNIQHMYDFIQMSHTTKNPMHRIQ